MITHLASSLPVVHPATDVVLTLCRCLGTNFTLQEVVDAVTVHAPDLLEDLPVAWAHARARDQIIPVGLDSSRYRLIWGA